MPQGLPWAARKGILACKRQFHPPDRFMFSTLDRLEAFIADFEACKVPRVRWTHHAHLVVGFWYLLHHAPPQALCVVRERIKIANEAMGTANTDSGGYHETITRAYIGAIAEHAAQHAQHAPIEALTLLLGSPLADSGWTMKYYSRERLFSVLARKQWVEPDLLPLPSDAVFAPASATTNPSPGLTGPSFT
jgi:hypothetical protein